MQREYKALKNQVFVDGEYRIVPVREQDRYEIMRWRNEQVYHLRQSKPLSAQDQDLYFSQVVSKLFNQDQPNQILFSYLKNDICIGYGGLVHVNWIDNNGEISFVMNTALEEDFFEFHWRTYLGLIEQVAFKHLDLNKIFTHAFDLRPRLYTALNDKGFTNEARLKGHCCFDGEYRDVLIHSKFKTDITLKFARKTDVEITHKWAKDSRIRALAIQQKPIEWEEHRLWFLSKINQANCKFYIVEYHTKKIGSFRLDIDNDQVAWISYLLEPDLQGRGLGRKVLEEGLGLAKRDPNIEYLAGQVFEQNEASMHLFTSLRFQLTESDKSGLVTFKMKIK